ncbi:acetyl-CoA carboxylase biotin carboxyl carrier protein [Pseudobutyrivibrio sp. MD2005]|uniref:acetyl-CoA carboxylase biotin carboxyl carrier protein n=1 Tax=Pseudobutyrivibrio sp. MD2005 TaxID=1410616 RepID=UPI00048310FA|nr:acetyl-CoA carboxylase biotin carboxyl carrier protein [Pseudobutyrivibrio sp. MD2005]
MEITEVKELLKAFDESDSTFLSLEQDGVKLKLKKAGNEVVFAAPQTIEKTVSNTQISNNVASDIETTKEELEEGEKVLAPLVGVFYAAPSPEEDAYVQVGDKVKAGQILCLIEAMKMMSEITAPCDGVIKKIYVKNQDVVEFEAPLFLIGD